MALLPLKDLLAYCEEYLEYREDGNLYWKKNKGRGKQGEIAGSVYWCGYRAIKIRKTTNYIHRIIFAMHYKHLPKYVDHINYNRLDNRIENLRECTNSENMRHVPASRNTISGRVGVSWERERQFWSARIRVEENKSKFLGYFEELSDAIEAREEAERLYYGEFAPHNFKDVNPTRKRYRKKINPIGLIEIDL